MAINIDPFSNILAVLEHDARNDIALSRAVRLAKASQGKVTVFMSFYNKLDNAQALGLPDNLSELVKEYEAGIHEQLEKWQATSLLNGIILSFQSKPSIAINKLISENSLDLIVKSPYPQTQLKSLFRSGLDKYFIGECPIPVWIVKPKLWDDNIEVLACLDMGDDKFENQKMNRKIMAMADHLSHRLDGELHVLDCFYGEIGTMRIDYNHKRGFKHEPTLKEQHLQTLKTYIAEYSLPDDVLHIEEGIPDEAIPNRAASLNAEVAIIGNNEDNNFIDKFLGDTAAELTKVMPCDVLILKA